MSEEKDNRVQTYVERLRRQSRRYAEQLWSELEHLRAMTASFEKEHQFLLDRNRRLEIELEELQRVRTECALMHAENARLTELTDFYAKERAELRVRVTEIEAETSRYVTQYLDVEQQNTALANLYVSMHQLHSTLDRDAVLGGIKEIIINIVGSEELAIYERHDGQLKLVDSFGIDEGSLATLSLDDGGWIAGAVNNNTIFVRGGETAPLSREEALTACVPIRRGDDVTGAVAVFRLLQQKPALEAVDHEIFELLATHVGMALYTTSMHAERGA